MVMILTKCENNFCVYYQKGCCRLDDISLNDLGVYSECVYIPIPEPVLQSDREKFFRDHRDKNKKALIPKE